MKWIVIIASLLLTSCTLYSYLSPGKGHVIFDFYVVDEGGRKDYWLGMFSRGRSYHLSSQDPVQQVQAGTYTISHFDRTANWGATRDDIRLARDDYIEFDVKEGEVVYLGVFTLKKTDTRDVYEIGYATGLGLMQRACTSSPELFESNQVSLGLITWKGKREIEYDCGDENLPRMVQSARQLIQSAARPDL